MKDLADAWKKLRVLSKVLVLMLGFSSILLNLYLLFGGHIHINWSTELSIKDIFSYLTLQAVVLNIIISLNNRHRNRSDIKQMKADLISQSSEWRKTIRNLKKLGDDIVYLKGQFKVIADNYLPNLKDDGTT